jgi:hypothetical protein
MGNTVSEITDFACQPVRQPAKTAVSKRKVDHYYRIVYISVPYNLYSNFGAFGYIYLYRYTIKMRDVFLPSGIYRYAQIVL